MSLSETVSGSSSFPLRYVIFEKLKLKFTNKQTKNFFLNHGKFVRRTFLIAKVSDQVMDVSVA